MALMLSKCLGTGNRHQPFFGCCPRGVRNWKQACPIFSELPAFRVEFPQSWGDNRIEGGNPDCDNRIEGGNPSIEGGNPGASQPLAKKKRAAAAPSRTLTVPRALAICAICAISHKASH